MMQLNPHKDTYAIGLPLDAADIHIPIQGVMKFNVNQEKYIYFIPSFDWQILGEVTKDSISFDPDPILIFYAFNGYKDYLAKSEFQHFSEQQSNESFYSLLAANGVYFVNPISYPEIHHSFDGCENPTEDMICPTWISEWQSYENKLVEKVLIIKKTDSLNNFK
jgi:hypothetical protein